MYFYLPFAAFLSGFELLVDRTQVSVPSSSNLDLFFSVSPAVFFREFKQMCLNVQKIETLTEN